MQLIVSQQKKIVIIICYYGKFPWYFAYFLHSCAYNLSIDFILFSNIKYVGELPLNVSMINISLEDFKKLAEKRLGFEVNVDTPYKLCDFKPAYGLIFSEYIQGYDFWGQSDIDVIYGDIRNFITDEMLAAYEFINVRHDYVTGFFALYKNNKKMNTFFMRSKDYKLVLSSPQHYSFCECNFMWDELSEGRSILDLDTEIESFTHIVRLAQSNKELQAHFDFIVLEGMPGRIRFNHGKIIYKNRFEAMLYHLYDLKKVYSQIRKWRIIPESYKISSRRIYV